MEVDCEKKTTTVLHRNLVRRSSSVSSSRDKLAGKKLLNWGFFKVRTRSVPRGRNFNDLFESHFHPDRLKLIPSNSFYRFCLFISTANFLLNGNECLFDNNGWEQKLSSCRQMLYRRNPLNENFNFQP